MAQFGRALGSGPRGRGFESHYPDQENKMDRRIPLFFALKNYIDKKRPAFHMPGHHRGKGIHKYLKEFWGENVFLFDITEVEGMDYLHKPEGVIKEAQELAAKAFGAKKTFFLINGSTVGNLVMLVSTLNPQDKVILQRNSHRSNNRRSCCF